MPAGGQPRPSARFPQRSRWCTLCGNFAHPATSNERRTDERGRGPAKQREKGAFGMSQMNPGMGPGQGAQSRPGQMTAVMRAMQQATGPKVLRIGLVASGRILEERIVKQRTSVTVGPSEKSMFVVQA